MLVSSSGFSNEALLRAGASKVPMSLVSLRREERGIVCEALTVNPVLRELLGSALEVFRERRVEGGEESMGIRWAGNERG